MKMTNDKSFGVNPETERRYEAMRYNVIDMHLFNDEADEEKALCGDETSCNVRSVRYYLEDRVHGPSVGSICQECKVLAVPLAEEIIEAAIEDHEAEGRLDIAEDYHELGKMLAGETGQDSLAN